jgi:hypothetical protein
MDGPDWMNRLAAPPALPYDSAVSESTRADGIDVDALARRLVEVGCSAYAMTRAGSTLGEVTLPDGFTYLYDDTSIAVDGPADAADFRVLCVWGRSRPAKTARDASRMRGYPSPQRDETSATDRGHLIAHSMGGGYDINLFPQAAAINRKGAWRELECYCADNPGTFLFLHLHYADRTDRPVAIDYSVLRVDGTLDTTRFEN